MTCDFSRGGGARLPAALIAVFAALAFASVAAAAPVLPQNVGPGQVKRQMESLPSVLPQRQGSAPPARSAGTRVKIAEQSLVLSGVLVEGAAAFENTAFLPLYESYLGTTVTIAELRRIADAVTAKYHRAGYFLSYALIPAQQIEFGIVRIRVVEGYIFTWRAAGGITAHDPVVGRMLQATLAERPLRRATLNNAFRRLAALSDLSLHSQVEQIADRPGAYELVIDGGETHADGSVVINNHGADYLGSVQGQLALRVMNATGRHEVYRFRLATTDRPTELRYFEVGTQWLVGDSGASVQAEADHANANPGGRLKDLGAHIDNNHFQLGLLYPLQRSAMQASDLAVTADVYRSTTELLGTQRIENRLTSATIAYHHLDQHDARFTQSVDLFLTQGLAIAGSRVIDTLGGTEPGSPSFFKANMDYSYLRMLGRNLALSVQVEGQYAAGPLPALERYSIGGERFGRAYDPSEIVGDSGLAGRLELSFDATHDAGWSAAPYTYYGLGAVWQAGHNAGRGSLASCGLGLRAASGGLSAYVEAAKPLTRPVDSQGNKDARVFGGMAYQF